jgi:hypothetical protein
MRTSNPIDPINQAICDQLLLNKPIRQIARFIKPNKKCYHPEVLRRIKKVLIPSGLVYEYVKGVYRVNEEFYEACKQNGVVINDSRENQKSKRIKGSGKKHSQPGGSNNTTPHGHARVHGVSLYINRITPASTNIRENVRIIPKKVRTLWACDQPTVIQMKNWSKVDVVFRNYRAYLTPTGVVIYGIQAFGDMHTPTMDVFDKGIQFTISDFKKIENLFSAATNEKIRLEKGEDGKVIVSEITTTEIAHTNDPGAKRMLMGRAYMVIRDVDGRIRFKLDRSEGPEELEGVGEDALTAMERVRDTRLRLGEKNYTNVMNYVADGNDIIGDIQGSIKQIQSQQAIISEQDKRITENNMTIKQLASLITLMTQSLQELTTTVISQRDIISSGIGNRAGIDYNDAVNNINRRYN